MPSSDEDPQVTSERLTRRGLVRRAARSYWNLALAWKVAIGIVAGVIGGLALGSRASVVEPLGDLFLNLLLFVGIPLIFFTLIRGIATMEIGRAGSIAWKILVYYIVSTAMAVALGVGCGWVFGIGSGTGLGGAQHVEEPKTPHVGDILFNIVPENPFKALSDGKPLQIIFVAVLLGGALAVLKSSSQAAVREPAKTVVAIVETMTNVFFVLVRLVLQYAPIGVFALIAVPLGSEGLGMLTSLAALVGVFFLAAALQMVFYGSQLAAFGMSPWRWLKAVKDPALTGFVTRSSSATLPVNMRAAERVGLSDKVYGFTLPLGAVINMDGVAIEIGLVSVFAANIADVSLGGIQILTIVIVATLAAIGTASVPGVTLIAISLVFHQVGLPLAVVGLIAVADQPLGMMNTAINVSGDLAGTSIVGKIEGLYDSTSEDWLGRKRRHGESSGTSGKEHKMEAASDV